MNYLAIFIGGGIGSLLRYFTSSFFSKFSFTKLPLGTLISNIFASLFLGLIMGYFLTKNIKNDALRNLLIIGICGGFSTFSTFAFENYSMIEQSKLILSISYILISVILSLLAIFIGIYLSENIFSN